MNDQIKKLAEQAGSTHKQNLGVYQFYTDELTKFAELIVKECAGIAYEYDIPNLTGPGEFIGNRMKKHFGVEDKAECKHDWHSARNPVVKNGSVCIKCGAIDPREPEELLKL